MISFTMLVAVMLLDGVGVVLHGGRGGYGGGGGGGGFVGLGGGGWRGFVVLEAKKKETEEKT